MGFQLGKTYGDYTFIDVENSSPLGIAYKVRNEPEHRIELLRVLSRTEEDDAERQERFHREASVHARLIHPNVVTFYRGLVLENQFVITTELVEGTYMSGRLELGATPPAEAVSYVNQILAALAMAHKMGVVHRDIRPANLILTPDGVIKLTGFTLAKSAMDTQVTQIGASMGDVHYISPEQVKGEVGLDPRTDLYSLGVVFYEMLAGRKPFEGGSSFDIMLAHVSEQARWPRGINPDIPTELETVVLKAMSKEPAGRFPSAEVFLAAIEGASRKLTADIAGPETAPFAPADSPAVSFIAATPLREDAPIELPADLETLRFGTRDAVVLAFGLVVVIAGVLMLINQ